MSGGETLNLDQFQFRGLHPEVFLGTASDRYAGWIGQIYSEARYSDRISRRTHTVGGKTFGEDVLPVESVAEYFDHFRVLELDFTFYRLLIENDGQPGQNYRVLQRYRQFLKEHDRIILKVPQVIFAQKLWRGGKFTGNQVYLNPEIFSRQFYEPALELFGPNLKGLVFEQEYQRKQDRSPPRELATALAAFFDAIPGDDRYHVELRTEALLCEAVFEVFARHGIGQVLSHWTWLPPLQQQFAESGKRFFNSGKQCIVRLMTPRGKRYEDAYAEAHPFDRMVEGMLDSRMVEDAAELMWKAIDEGVQMNLIVNNRAGGNAPLIARHIAQRFLDMRTRRGTVSTGAAGTGKNA
jgi:uncharacterized protein YecE (DUF72 family)